LFADTIKIARPINSATDGSLPHSDSDSICGWCAANCMKFNTDETKVRSTMLTMCCLINQLGLICPLTYPFSTTDCSLLLYTPVSPR
jgi:hypothetical protein